MKIRELIHELLEYDMDKEVYLERKGVSGVSYHEDITVVFSDEKLLNGSVIITGE